MRKKIDKGKKGCPGPTRDFETETLRLVQPVFTFDSLTLWSDSITPYVLFSLTNLCQVCILSDCFDKRISHHFVPLRRVTTVTDHD